MKSGNLKHVSAAIGATTIWGTFSIPLRTLKEYPSSEIITYRLLFSLIITWIVIGLFRRKYAIKDFNYLASLKFKKRIRLLSMVLLSGCFLTGNWVSFLYAVNYVSLKSAAFGYMICPLVTAMGGFFILKEQLTPLKVAAMAIALVSILWLGHGSLIEIIWSIMVAVTYSCYLLTQRVIVKLNKLNVLGIQLILSAVLILPFSNYFFGAFTTPAEPYFLTTMFIIAAFFTVIPLFLVSYALVGIPSSTLGIIVYLNPIIAFSLAFTYFEEALNRDQLFAYSMLLASIIIFNWEGISSYLSKYFNKENELKTQPIRALEGTSLHSHNRN